MEEKNSVSPIGKAVDLIDKPSPMELILKIAPFFVIPIFLVAFLLLAGDYVNGYLYLIIALLPIPLFASIKAKGNMQESIVSSVVLSLTTIIPYSFISFMQYTPVGPTSATMNLFFTLQIGFFYPVIETVITALLNATRHLFVKNKNAASSEILVLVSEKRIYSWYLVTVIICSIFSIIYYGLTHIFTTNDALLSNLDLIIIKTSLFAIYFIFNLVMFFVILAKRIEIVALWIPGIILGQFTIEFVALMIMSIFGSFVYSLIPIIIPIIIGIIAVRLLFRKKEVNKIN